MAIYRVGIDVGGTFTDLVAVSLESGALFTAKLPTTPTDPTIGCVNVLNRFLGDVNDTDVSLLMAVHGTTTATNAVLEGKFPSVALITTKGFRDVLEIGRHLRKELYNLFIDKPKTLIARHMRFEIDERSAPNGKVLTGIDEVEARILIEKIIEAKTQSVAICFINSYANQENEAYMKELIQKYAPELFQSASYEICREYREFERMSTTAMNAALMPIISTYINRLYGKLKSYPGAPSVFIMQSNGGVATVEASKEGPVNLLLSGPAGGVKACQYLGKMIDCPNIIGFDMGGTSTDISVVVDGEPNVTMDGMVAGYPIKRPIIEINTIGAGGGSIAYLDAGGSLRVGPESAGADPGPICYDQGGTRPTVTDANVVLGRIDPNYFLGGEMKLNYTAAKLRMEEMGREINMDAASFADGIIRIANANMERAIRVSSVEKGLDPRDFAMVAFGGAGALHANALAEALDIPKVVIPEVSSELSALGLLSTDIRHDYSVTKVVRSDQLYLDEIEGIFQDLEQSARKQLMEENVAEHQYQIRRMIDMRYVGQAYEISIPMAEDGDLAVNLQNMLQEFHKEHERLYTYCSPEKVMELVNFRVAGVGLMEPIRIQSDVPVYALNPPAALKDKRLVYIKELAGFCPCPIFERSRLVSGNVVTGPAVIEQFDSTTLILPGYQATVDVYRNLIINKAI